jgi:hypothetical protein
MKYLKSFENIKSEKNRELQEWDYVVIKTNDPEHSKSYDNFLKNHILQVREIHGNYIYASALIDDDESEETRNAFGGYIQPFRIDKIKYYGDNIEELKIKMQQDKYNL